MRAPKRPERLEVTTRREPGEVWILRVEGVLTPGLNGAAGLRRMPWQAYRALVELLSFAIAAARPLPTYTSRVRARYTRGHGAQAMDEDNLVGSWKPLGDALVRAHVLADDSPDLLTIEARQEPRGRRRPFFEVRLEPLPLPLPLPPQPGDHP